MEHHQEGNGLLLAWLQGEALRNEERPQVQGLATTGRRLFGESRMRPRVLDHRRRVPGASITGHTAPALYGRPLPENEAVRRLHAQYAVARALAETTSLAEAAPRVLRAICEALGWDHGGLWRVDAAAGVLRCVETWQTPGLAFPAFEEASRRSTFAPGDGLPGRVWESRRPAFIPDVSADDNFPRAKVASREGLRGALGTPILLGEQVLGVLEFFSREIARPDEELLEMLATIGSQIGQFVERKRAEAELETLFETSPDMLCIAGVDGTFRRLNPAWEKTLGFTAAELMSRPYVEFVHPDDRGVTTPKRERWPRAPAPSSSRTATAARTAPTAGWPGNRRRSPTRASSTRWRATSPSRGGPRRSCGRRGRRPSRRAGRRATSSPT